VVRVGPECAAPIVTGRIPMTRPMLIRANHYARRRLPPRSGEMRMTDLRAGWAVLGNDGRRVGAVQSVGQNYILTSRHGLSADLYLPASSIANVENETIHLNITQRDAEQMGWEQVPRDDELEADPESDLHRHV